jgi:hypothetical protein
MCPKCADLEVIDLPPQVRRGALTVRVYFSAKHTTSQGTTSR